MLIRKAILCLSMMIFFLISRFGYILELVEIDPIQLIF